MSASNLLGGFCRKFHLNLFRPKNTESDKERFSTARTTPLAAASSSSLLSKGTGEEAVVGAAASAASARSSSCAAIPAAATGAAAEEVSDPGSAQDAEIEIPPPMESLSTDKLINNGAAMDPAGTSSLPKDFAPSPDNTAATTEELAQEIESMVKLRIGAGEGNPEESVAENGDRGAASTDQTPEAQAKHKRHFVLMELVETERDYVKDLGAIVEGYIATVNSMELPEAMKGKDRIIFANIQQIHEFHKTNFLREIEKSLENYEAAGQAFVKYERRLHMYVVYCQNKPKSEFLVSEYENFFNEIRQKLGHKLTLADLLIKPVQRIMKYQLLLKDILKYTERAGESTQTLKKALEVMHVVPKACDDMMHVGRLQNFEGKITAQGKLLLQGTLIVSDNPPGKEFKGKDRRVFMFEQSLIMADCILPKKEYSNPTYIYKSHILINKMQMETDVAGDPLRFVLKNKDPQTPQGFVLQAASGDEKQMWIHSIKQLLDKQDDFLRALQRPIDYQKGLVKE